MRLLATSEDLRNFLGKEEIDRARADFILGAVSDEVRKFSRLTFETHTDEEITLDGSGTTILLLPALPVTDVSSVVVAEEELDEIDDYEWSAKGILRRLGGYVWEQKFRSVTVTYSHGFTEVPEDVRLLVVRVAARGWANPTSVTNESAAGYSAGYGFDASRNPQLTDADRQVLREYMGR